jgi:tripartite-type tricarboxylate transporter receptor subunit TctC
MNRLLQRRHVLAASLAAALLPAASCALAAEAAWPERPIKWVVPYLAGTGPDITARILAEAVGPLLGQAVVIENKAGAAGNIGARLVARAAPDGYTWVYSAAPMAANMRMYRDPGYDALKDFRHIMRVSTSDIALVVNAASGTGSLDELAAKARANPGALNYASGGVGTPSHLGVELLLNALNAQALHVPYKGASELVNAILGNQVTFGTPILSVAYPLIQSGKLKPLAIAGARRNPKLPDVPTLAELGVKGVELTSWGGVSVPAGTPDAVAARIAAAFEKALAMPSVQAGLTENGGQASPLPAPEYTRGFTKEMTLTEVMMKQVKLQPQ